jgi:hypothetical protein
VLLAVRGKPFGHAQKAKNVTANSDQDAVEATCKLTVAVTDILSVTKKMSQKFG